MNYHRMLYETTAWLLMLQVQMKEYPFSTVVSRYLEESAFTDSGERAVDSVAVLLALDRNGEPMTAEIINRLEQNLAELKVSGFPENDRTCIEADLKTVKTVIEWYRTTEGKILNTP